MNTSQISFLLANTSPDADAIVVLIPAMLRRKVLLNGKFLKLGEFMDEAGSITIVASQELPEKALAELSEYASQLEGIKVTAVRIETDNFAQATLNLMEKTYVPFSQAIVKSIETSATLEIGGGNAVVHSFNTPFSTGQMRSLEMKLLKNQHVKLTLFVEMPDLGNAAQVPLTLPVIQ